MTDGVQLRAAVPALLGRQRFEWFSLSLNPDKTRLIEFGRFAAERRAHRGLEKPETWWAVSKDRPYRASR